MEDINNIPICAWCQKEFNIIPPPKLSHGVCERHARQTLKNGGMSDEYIDSFIKKSQSICIDLSTRPDLLQQYQKES